MLASLVHPCTRSHPELNRSQSGAQGADPGQSFHERTGGITHHLSKLDQTALLIVPGKEEHEPVLEKEPNEFGIQFTQHALGVGRPPFIDLPALLP